VFRVTGSIPIADVIDAIEAIGDSDLISVEYPPEADQCTIQAEGLNAELIFDRSEITIKMPGKAKTADLLNESRSLPNLLQDRGIVGLLPAPKDK
jgi:hypothetical protein